MKNGCKINLIRAILLVPFAALMVGVLSAAKAPTGEVAANGTLFMPEIQSDFTDMDFRDAQNRPISNPLIRDTLTKLLKGSILPFVLEYDLHITQKIQDEISVLSRLFDNLFFNSKILIEDLKNWALAPPQKRFVHIVQNLWITLSIFTVLSLVGLRFCRQHRCCSPACLRC